MPLLTEETMQKIVHILSEVGIAENIGWNVSLAGRLGDVGLICVCRRALPLHLLLTALAFYSGAAITFFKDCLRDW